jgi:hypothetical protein
MFGLEPFIKKSLCLYQTSNKMEIIITETAELSYNKIKFYYNEKNKIQLAKETIHAIDLIKLNNLIGSVHKKTSFRKFLVNSDIYLFYSLDFKKINILLFWDNRKNPLELDNVLVF